MRSRLAIRQLAILLAIGNEIAALLVVGGFAGEGRKNKTKQLIKMGRKSKLSAHQIAEVRTER